MENPENPDEERSLLQLQVRRDNGEVSDAFLKQNGELHIGSSETPQSYRDGEAAASYAQPAARSSWLPTCSAQACRWSLAAVVATALLCSLLFNTRISLQIIRGDAADSAVTPAASAFWASDKVQSDVNVERLLLLLNSTSASINNLRDHPPPPPPPPAAAAAPAASSGSDDGRMTVEQFLARADDVDFLLDNGVETDALAPRRVKRVNREAVNTLRKHVTEQKLVEGWDNLLFIGIINLGYIDFAYNWICFMQRHGLTNFLLGTVDDASHVELTRLGYGRHLISLKSLLHDPVLEACGGDQTHDFRTDCFNKQTQGKALLVLTALFAGYDILLTDMDIHIIHNPLLYMPLNHSWEMQLEPNEWCSGWYYNKASPLTIRMQHEVLDVFDRLDHLDDQQAYNHWIRAYRLLKDPELRRHLWSLNRQLFPNGEGIHYASKQGVIQHNNWIMKAVDKRIRQKQHGLHPYNKDATDAKVKEFMTTNPDEQKLLHHDSLLVCDECTVCKDYHPALKPLREKYPGPITVADIAPYEGTGWI
jgi:hypothetical protein